jgi:methylthioribose-1-phosphate isomerase
MPILEPIQYARGWLKLLDQRQLPLREVYVDVESCEDAHTHIKEMTVRGAPAIAVAGVLALAVELHNAGAGSQFDSAATARDDIKKKLDYLVTRCAVALPQCSGASVPHCHYGTARQCNTVNQCKAKVRRAAA